MRIYGPLALFLALSMPVAAGCGSTADDGGDAEADGSGDADGTGDDGGTTGTKFDLQAPLDGMGEGEEYGSCAAGCPPLTEALMGTGGSCNCAPLCPSDPSACPNLGGADVGPSCVKGPSNLDLCVIQCAGDDGACPAGMECVDLVDGGAEPEGCESATCPVCSWAGG